MTQDDLEQLLERTPQLFHMAEHKSHHSILTHGLLSTSALLDLFGYKGSARETIEARRRGDSVEITHPELGTAVVRDQKPMTDDGLRQSLQDGLSPEDWYKFLNKHVFFWLTEERLTRMLCARPYKNKLHDVLVIDGPSLIRDFQPSLMLSQMNSGSTKPFPWPRGKSTFQNIENYPLIERQHQRKEGAIEVAVEYSVPNIKDYIIEIQERDCSGIYRRY